MSKRKANHYTFQKYWYLGFLGLAGIHYVPHILTYLQGSGTAWELAGLLWLLWFSYFLPKRHKNEKTN